MYKTLVIVVALLLGTGQSYADTYSWKDDKGVMNFTDDPALIPPKYRTNAQKGEDITIQNPKVLQSLKDQEERAKEDINRSPRIEPTPDYVAAPVVAPAKPSVDEQPTGRTKSQKIRDNIERREKELGLR